MSLQQKLIDDLKVVLKGGKEFEVGVLRLLLSALHNREIEKRGKSGKDESLTEEEAVEVLKREVKKRREAAELFLKGGRRELADKEKAESAVIQKYLPAEMTAEELSALVDQAIKMVNPAGPKDFGRVISEVMKSAKGRADGSLVSEIIKRKISGQ